MICLSKKAKKSSALSLFFTAEVFGLALALICLLGLLCLATGDLIFGEEIGVKINMFFLGACGYFSFPILLLFAFLGVKMLIGFSVENDAVKRFFKYFSIYLILAGLIVHTALTPVTLDFAEYISHCYNGGLSLNNTTPGGVVLGVIAGPLATWLTPIGAYILYAVALIITTVILLRSNISQMIINSREEKANKPKKEKTQIKRNKEKEETFVPTEETFFEEEPEMPKRTIHFGGGDFEKKDAKTKKGKSETSQGLHVLFEENAFTRNSPTPIYENPLQSTKSYREKYDEDIERKTEFVRRPYETVGKNVVYPMGDSDRVDNTTLYNSGRGEGMDIDLSEPEKDVYVFNRKGTSRETFSPFNKARENSNADYNNGESGDSFGQNRFSSRVSSYEENAFYNAGRSEDNSFSRRTEENSFSRSREESGFSGRSEEGFARRDENSFSGRREPSFEEHFNNVMNSKENGFSNTNRTEESLFGRTREESSFGGSHEDDFSRREENPFGRNREESLFGRRREDDFSRREENPFGRNREESSFGRTREDGFARREENPFGRTREEGGFARNRVNENSFGNRRDSEEDYSFGEKPARENPITKAMRESEEQSRNQTTNKVTNNYNYYNSDSISDPTPDYNGESGISYGGSFFDTQEKRAKPNVVRDRSHQVNEKPQEKPAPTEKTSAVSSNPISTVQPISGKQISMSNIPPENKLENPIDTMPKNYKFAFPPISLLEDYLPDEKAFKKNKEEQENRANTICQILKNGNIDAVIEDIKYGPAITRFELSIPPTVSVKRINEKYEDLNLWLAAQNRIRLVTPILGTTKIGIEVPNSSPDTVGLKSIIESREFKGAKQSSLSFCLGKDIVGRPVVLDMAKMPHLLVAGATGTGKSVFLNTLLISLIYKYSPEELRIILVDPKVVEFSLFRGMPNLMFDEIFTDTAKVCSMLEWAVEEMEERYLKLREVLAKNIEEYNSYMEKKKGKKMPKILIIIDEFADLMNSSAERKLMENKISRLAAKARAAGIHLIMATQRPSADIMEGSIKTNFTSRIAFKMASATDAMVIMGEAGADKLLGRGDVLFRTSSMPTAERAQGCFVDTPEIERICAYVKENNKCYYDEFALEKIIKGVSAEEASASSGGGGFSGGELGGSSSDLELEKQAMRLAIKTNNISISGLQRKLSIGFPKAGKLVDTLVEKGYISESMDNKTRKIYMTKEQFEEVFGEQL